MVAFHCDNRNKFMNKNGEWQDDPSNAATCLQVNPYPYQFHSTGSNTKY